MSAAVSEGLREIISVLSGTIAALSAIFEFSNDKLLIARFTKEYSLMPSVCFLSKLSSRSTPMPSPKRLSVLIVTATDASVTSILNASKRSERSNPPPSAAGAASAPPFIQAEIAPIAADTLSISAVTAKPSL